MKIIRELKRRQKGLIVGAVVGAAAAYYAISNGLADLGSIAAAGEGLIDSMMTRSAPLELASYKLYGTFMFLGAAVGMIVETILVRMRIGR